VLISDSQVGRRGHANRQATSTYEEAARHLAKEVKCAPGADKAWPKITTVLDKFGEGTLTPEVGRGVDDALTGVGLRVDPPLETITSRNGTVCLSGSGNGTSHPSEFIRVMEMVPGEAPREWDGLNAPSTNGVLWVDIDILNADLRTLLEVLPRLCPGISEERITDLFLVDLAPKVESDDDGQVRAVSAVQVKAKETCGTRELHGRSKAGALSFQLVEIVSNEHWLVTCWHRERIHCGVDEDAAAGEVPDHRSVDAAVAARWQELGPARARTAGDLGVLLLEEITNSYERARLELYAWLDSWELDFFRRAGDDQIRTAKEIDRRTLVDLRALASEFRRQVTPLDVPRKKAKDEFFSSVSNCEPAERVDEVVDRSLDDLKDLTDRVRSSFDLVHLQMSDIQERHTVELQSKFEIIAAVFLAPTLIAGFFGANTWLPGGNDPHALRSFEVMVATMVVGALLAYTVIRFFTRKSRR
jgi:Mg2+ and Co2+ transporter CorA